MNRYTVLIFSFIALLLPSCNMRECRTNNPVFANFSPDSREYRNELAKQIQDIGPGNLSYWHDHYLKRDGDEYIVVQIQGDGLCAKGEIQVNDWTKMGGLRKEPSGYSGAELVGLDFEIVPNPSGDKFLFKNVNRIID